MKHRLYSNQILSSGNTELSLYTSFNPEVKIHLYKSLGIVGRVDPEPKQEKVMF